MSGDHGHGAMARRGGARHQVRLAVAFGLVLTFFLVEALTGVLTNSLALLSDAGHMFSDVLGLGMALAAIQLASRAAGDASDRDSCRTFGLYRLEILAAFVNALLLFAVAIWVLFEALQRLDSPPEVLGAPMLVVAALGLVVNLVAFALLRPGVGESLNVEAASLEVLADTLGSVGVIAAAVTVELTGWRWIDSVMAVAIGVFILPRTWRLGAQAVRILIQAAPPQVDLRALRGDLAGIAGVVDVHDVHVWTLTSEMETASAHLMVAEGADSHGVLDQARHLLQARYDIEHATLQVEPADHSGCDELTW